MLVSELAGFNYQLTNQSLVGRNENEQNEVAT